MMMTSLRFLSRKFMVITRLCDLSKKFNVSVFEDAKTPWRDEDIESFRGSRLITFPRQDHPDLQQFSSVETGTSGTIELPGFDAYDRFSVLLRRKTLTWNLQRNSSVRKGIKRDGSFIGGTPVVNPEEVMKDYPTFEQHMRSRGQALKEHEDKIKQFKTRYNIPHKAGEGFRVEDWTPSNSEFVTDQNWEQYGTHELFPYMMAATNNCYFVLRNEGEATIVRPLEPFPDIYARVARLKALEMFCIPTEHGVLVAAPWRFAISALWFLFSYSIGVVAAIHNRKDWFDSMESFFTAITVVGITLPAFVSLVIQEPDLIRNAIRGKKTLTSDQQVATWFGFTERDYAAAAICLNGTFLVSAARGRFLSGKANKALSGDGYLVSAGILQHVGVLVGRSMYKRLWEATNRIAEEVDSFVSHLTGLERKGDQPCWTAGCMDKRLVG